MKWLLTIASCVIYTFSISAQCEIILKPGADEGKDAFIRNYPCDALSSNCDTTNFGSSSSLGTGTWTRSGILRVDRGLIKFEGIVPERENCSLISAVLVLNHDPSGDDHCGETTTGQTPCFSNDFEITRILEPWNEDEVTWVNQPVVSSSMASENYLYVADSSAIPFLDYRLTITDMVRYWMQNPNENHGLRLNMFDETENWRRIRVASSDQENSSLHPELRLTYSCDDCSLLTSLDDLIERDFKILPNPITDRFRFSTNQEMLISYSIRNTLGQNLLSKNQVSTSDWVDVSDLNPGIYYYSVRFSDGAQGTGTLVIK